MISYEWYHIHTIHDIYHPPPSPPPSPTRRNWKLLVRTSARASTNTIIIIIHRWYHRSHCVCLSPSNTILNNTSYLHHSSIHIIKCVQFRHQEREVHIYAAVVTIGMVMIIDSWYFMILCGHLLWRWLIRTTWRWLILCRTNNTKSTDLNTKMASLLLLLLGRKNLTSTAVPLRTTHKTRLNLPNSGGTNSAGLNTSTQTHIPHQNGGNPTPPPKKNTIIIVKKMVNAPRPACDAWLCIFVAPCKKKKKTASTYKKTKQTIYCCTPSDVSHRVPKKDWQERNKRCEGTHEKARITRPPSTQKN